MAISSTPTPESAEIEAYVRELAPDVHEVSCGPGPGGSGYELWFRLNPTSSAKSIGITDDDYESEFWKDLVQNALEKANRD